MTALACPDCGAALTFRDLTNGTAVCECPNADCRADWMAHGATREQAAEKLVELCERYGYTAALEARLRELVEGGAPA